VARATKVVRKVKKCDQTKGSMRKSAKTEKVCQKLIKCDKYLNNLQVSFPLAFSHLLHQDIGIFEVFMATAYQPKNSHCIYIDAKADDKVYFTIILHKAFTHEDPKSSKRH